MTMIMRKILPGRVVGLVFGSEDVRASGYGTSRDENPRVLIHRQHLDVQYGLCYSSRKMS